MFRLKRKVTVQPEAGRNGGDPAPRPPPPASQGLSPTVPDPSPIPTGPMGGPAPGSSEGETNRDGAAGGAETREAAPMAIAKAKAVRLTYETSARRPWERTSRREPTAHPGAAQDLW